jgi:flagellar biogenesis protein FliO
VRAAVNTSPEPVSNVLASTAEDVLVGGLLALVLAYPLVALGVVIALVALAAWLLPKLWRLVRRVFGPRVATRSREEG